MKTNHKKNIFIQIKTCSIYQEKQKKILEVLLLLLLSEYCQEINMSENIPPRKFLKVLKTKIANKKVLLIEEIGKLELTITKSYLPRAI